MEHCEGHHQQREQDVPEKDKIKTRQTVKRPTATLKDSLEYLVSRHSLHVTTISYDFAMGQVSQPTSEEKKKHPSSPNSPQTLWQNILWSDETKVELLKKYIWHKNKTAYFSKAWWWQHHMVLLVFAGNWAIVKIKAIIASSKSQSVLAPNWKQSSN